MISTRTARHIGLAAAAIALVAPAAASAARADDPAPAPDQAKTCANKFDEAQRTDMESFRDFDRETWLAGHDRGVVSIVADGRVRVGLDAVAAASLPRFQARNSVWSWSEITRHVDGCTTAVIVYKTRYALPHLDYWFDAVTTVTYTYEGGRWLTVLDQGTLLEEHIGDAG